MSVQALFDVGRSALFTAQRALNITGHNIANVNTEGYARQEAVIKTISPQYIGTGAVGRGAYVDSVRMHYNAFINAQLANERQNYGMALAMAESLGMAETVFNEVEDIGLATQLNGFFNAWTEVANAPDSEPSRVVLLQRADDLVQMARKMERGLEDVISNMNSELIDIIERVNTITANIATLNGNIKAATESANDLISEREKLVEDLGELVGLTSFESTEGVTIIIGRQNVVDGVRQVDVGSTYGAGMQLQVDVGGIDVTSMITRGKIGGLLAVRSEVSDNMLTPLRTLVAGIVDEVNTQHRLGYSLDGVTGTDFFTPASTADLTNVIKNFGVALTNPRDVAAALPDNDSTVRLGAIQSDAAETVSFTMDGVAVSFAGTGNATTDATNLYDALVALQGGGDFTGYTFSNDVADTVVMTRASSTAGIAITAWAGTDNTSDTAATLTVANGSSSTSAVLDDDAVAGGGAAVTAATITPPASAPGDNRNALLIAGLGFKQDAIGTYTFSEYYRTIVTGVGSVTKGANDSLQFEGKLLEDIQARRDSVSSVSLDEEAINLIKFQRSFEAGARIITMTDELLEIVVNMV